MNSWRRRAAAVATAAGLALIGAVAPAQAAVPGTVSGATPAFLGGAASVAPIAPAVGSTVGGQTVTVATPQNGYISASTNGDLSAGVSGTGAVWSWGSTNATLLGTAVPSTYPIKAARLTLPAGVLGRQVSVGAAFTVLLATDGSVWSWGTNASGQLGDGTTTTRPTPVKVALPAGVVATQVVAGADSASALASDGSVWSWGANASGQLGDGATTARPTPVRTALTVKATSVARGTSSFFAVAADGSAWAAGANVAGALGVNRSDAKRLTATAMVFPAGVKVAALSGGYQHGLALSTDGRAWAWGAGGLGRLGTGSTANAAAPVAVKVPAGVTFTSVSAGGGFSSAVSSDGRVWQWGQDLVTSSTTRTVPTQVTGATTVGGTTVAGATRAGFVLGTNGALLAWGKNTSNEINGSANVAYPTLVPGENPFSFFKCCINVEDRVLTVSFGDSSVLTTATPGFTSPVQLPARPAGVVSLTVTFSSEVTESVAFPAAFTYVTAPVFNTAAPPSGTVGKPYSYTFGVDGSTPTGMTIASGVLPAGLTLSGTTVSGTPTTVGLSAVTFVPTSAAGPGLPLTYSFEVRAAGAPSSYVGTSTVSAATGGTVTIRLPGGTGFTGIADAGYEDASSHSNGHGSWESYNAGYGYAYDNQNRLWTLSANAATTTTSKGGAVLGGGCTGVLLADGALHDPTTGAVVYQPASGLVVKQVQCASDDDYGSGSNAWTVVLLSDGTVWEIAHGTPIKIAIPAGKVITQVAGYYERFGAVASDGTVWSWAFDLQAAAGTDHPTVDEIAVPVAAAQVAVGSDGTGWGGLVLGKDGSVWSVGVGATTTRVTLPAGLTVAEVGGTATHAFLRGTDGTLWWWGQVACLTWGQFTFYGSAACEQPVTLAAPTKVALPWAAGYTVKDATSAMLLRSDGTVWTWNDAVASAFPNVPVVRPIDTTEIESVKIGATTTTAITRTTDDAITVVAPPHAAGAVDIVVRTIDHHGVEGWLRLTGALTYR